MDENTDGNWFNQLLRALQDPRLAMLLGPAGSLVRAPGMMANAGRMIPNMASQRGSWNPWGWRGTRPAGDALPDPGGSNIPLLNRLEHNPNPMIQDRLKGVREGAPFDSYDQDIYSKTHMLDVRHANQVADGMANVDPLYSNRRAAWEQISKQGTSGEQLNILKTVQAKKALEEMIGSSRHPRQGGIAQSEMLERMKVNKLFGFE